MKTSPATLVRRLLACLSLAACACFAHNIAYAQAGYPQAGAAGPQDAQAVRNAIEQFLALQTANLPGKVSYTTGTLDGRALPPACPQLQVFFPNGNRPWGKTTVGVRCSAPAWVRYVQARVTVVGEYYVAAVPLTAGQVIQAAQLTKMQGDLSAMPPGLITDPAQAEGRVLALSIQAGAVLRQDTLRAQSVIQQGQMVQVVASGTGFRVATEARALGNAKEGQLVQLKTEAGKMISGIARSAGLAEVVN